MKKIILIIFLLHGITGNSQQPEKIIEFHELSINDSFEFDDYEIKFVDVLSDNRCPKAVMCIVAGEAKVAFEVYKSGKILSKQILRFTPTVYLPNSQGNIYNSDLIKITGVELTPYPVLDNSILKSDYRLKLVFEEILQ
ncbi:hypothetical protein ACFQ1Q_04340 [Winogradskyella litorisediminis]|uniref:Uncharacterized protein n=1 Tax=Winogradskyella litorisediminis TaxID=1156618 RepID=A0ABW3N4F5_9FLAO